MITWQRRYRGEEKEESESEDDYVPYVPVKERKKAQVLKRRKLKWYEHVTRSTGLAKTILEDTVQEGRRRGRQKKRWEDSIPEWTGMMLGADMAERREELRELVARSYVARQQSTRLQDR
ncbi:hypothetical protein NP493_211g01021 [Ridgeia piscesae]|uniref:Uncharacterized protein n=1 Tax=Ridgeia piscesae TaxID=27915 RepID=A0AAD9P119_RIDPI|nr:hypothetical protein NP493_211g01021 [Ridgeia piscesae]